MHPSTLPMAMRAVRRDWRSGELRLLVAALVVAVGSITAVGFFTDRVEQAMEMRSSELLAADLLISSTEPIGAAFELEARELGLETARTLSFRSVLVADDAFQLAEVKAVGTGYPLRGAARLASVAFGPDRITERIPDRGTVWLDSRLMGLLDLVVGDRIDLGAASFRVEAVLTYEPDRGGNLFSIAPRLMMNLDDVPSTGLVLPGSRVSYALLTAGPPPAVSRFRALLSPQLEPGQHFHGVREARPELRTALDRAGQFLGLAALVSVMLAGAAIAVSARRYAERRLDTAAMMRCLGASQRTVGRVFTLQVLVVGLAASLLGCALGLVAQRGLEHLLTGLLLEVLPMPSWKPLGVGLAVGLITLAGFALPPIWRLRDVPPARVLRRDLGALPARVWSVYASGLIALIALIGWQARDLTLAAYVIGGGGLTVIGLGIAALAVVRGLGHLRSRVGVSWRFGLANVSRRAQASALQIVAFGLGIMVLLLLTLVRNDLLEEWQRSLPEGAPNFFLINVQPDDLDGLRAFLDGKGLAAAELHPMVRGRLSAINARPVSEQDYQEPRAQRLATREFNLSWSRRLQPDNRIVAGRWWDAAHIGASVLSMEAGIAETLGVSLGDALTFNVAGQLFTATVASLRTVEWDSFKVNFFVLAPPGMLEGYPATYITSFFLPPGRRDVLTELVRDFPSTTVLDVDALIAKVREVMAQAVLGVEYVFSFTLLAGVVVLLAAIQSTMDERRYETAIIKVLGGTRARLLRGLLAEFAILGAIAGLLAALAATVLGAILAEQVFQLSYRGDSRLWLVGLLAGATGISLAGVLSARSAIGHPPLETLRNT